MSGEVSPRHALPFLSVGQAQKELTHNEALALIDAGLHPAAESRGLNAPPGDAEAGQCWITGAAPEGTWTGQAHALACRTQGGWRFLAATPGMRVWLRDQQSWAVCEESDWVVGDVRGDRLLLGGQQVVAGRQAGIAAPVGGSTIDAEARAALAALIARLVSHGLIAA